MNSHNPKTESVIRTESVKVSGELDEVRVINTNLHEPVDLAISEDDDTGGDPYNSTGQHAIIKSKLRLQD